MSFDYKKNLPHWLFDGKNRAGKRYGIYVTKRGRGKDLEIDYFLYGRITGLPDPEG